MSIHLLGVRHHGPGSARAVQSFLEQAAPGLILIEGPPEADALLPAVAAEGMEPPVALLLYQPDDPQRAVFYPFAEFSPEWVSAKWAAGHKIPVRFMDLPAAHSFALDAAERERMAAEEAARAEKENGESTSHHHDADATTASTKESPTMETLTGADSSSDAPPQAAEHIHPPSTGDVMQEPHRDPIAHLAAAAGWDDGEAWWEHTFEHRRDATEAFTAISEAMMALREVLPQRYDEYAAKREVLREAWMRKTVKAAVKEGYENIAVICGAWHVPALAQKTSMKEDADLLKGLPKTKVAATWIPWTYNRLHVRSGYGAGITAPGWYEHLWRYPDDDGTRWVSRIAGLFREKGMDTSTAHVIEAVRLAESLAAVRGHSRAGLAEMNEAVRSVLCGGEDVGMELVREEVIVSDRIGTVPSDVPRPPLQVDIDATAKKLRLPQAAEAKDFVLDLRKDADLARSVFLHRLGVLGIGWGVRTGVTSKGTFKEGWKLQWQPEFSVDIIEKGAWGATLKEAAGALAVAQANESGTLPTVVEALTAVIPADLPGASRALAAELQTLAAATTDVLGLMAAVPPLVRIVRYGDVRRTEADAILPILEPTIARVCIGLPLAVCGIDGDTAVHLTGECADMQHSIQVLAEPVCTAQWQACLRQIAGGDSSAPMLRGFSVRQLMDYKLLAGEALQQIFWRSLSAGMPPDAAAAWLEGFLHSRGTVLLIDEALWRIVDDWVRHLDEATFTAVLPLLRRTFSQFSPAERRKMGEKAKRGVGDGGGVASGRPDSGVDDARGRRGVPVVLQLLGIKVAAYEEIDGT